jgi:peptidyl-prolyl cis-trans isomerase SurA
MREVPAALVLLAALSGARGAGAEPTTIERAVARVDGRPILLSEIRQRARPYLARLHGAVARAVATRRTYRELLALRIDEELIAERTEAGKISVSERELGDALDRMASERHVDRPTLLVEALAAGYPEASYRAEIRRQLLEQKWVTAEIARRGARWPEDSRRYAVWFERERKQLVAELRKTACIERLVRW